MARVFSSLTPRVIQIWGCDPPSSTAVRSPLEGMVLQLSGTPRWVATSKADRAWKTRGPATGEKHRYRFLCFQRHEGKPGSCDNSCCGPALVRPPERSEVTSAIRVFEGTSTPRAWCLGTPPPYSPLNERVEYPVQPPPKRRRPMYTPLRFWWLPLNTPDPTPSHTTCSLHHDCSAPQLSCNTSEYYNAVSFRQHHTLPTFSAEGGGPLAVLCCKPGIVPGRVSTPPTHGQQQRKSTPCRTTFSEQKLSGRRARTQS